MMMRPNTFDPTALTAAADVAAVCFSCCICCYCSWRLLQQAAFAAALICWIQSVSKVVKDEPLT